MGAVQTPAVIFLPEPEGAYDPPTLSPPLQNSDPDDDAFGFNPHHSGAMEADEDGVVEPTGDEGYLQLKDDEDLDELEYDEILESEAMEWVEVVTNRTSDGFSVREYLGDGVVLCHVMAKLQPLLLHTNDVNHEQTSSAMNANCELFIAAARRYGCSNDDLFEPADLFEGRNILKVIDAIHALGEHALAVGYTSGLANKIRKARKAREQQQALARIAVIGPPPIAIATLCEQKLLSDQEQPTAAAVPTPAPAPAPANARPTNQYVLATVNTAPVNESADRDFEMAMELAAQSSAENAAADSGDSDQGPSQRQSSLDADSDSDDDGDPRGAHRARAAASPPRSPPPARSTHPTAPRTAASRSSAAVPMAIPGGERRSSPASSPSSARATRSSTSSSGTPPASSARDRRSSKAGISRNRAASAVTKVAAQCEFKVVLPNVTRSRSLLVLYKTVAGQAELGKVEIYERKGGGKGMPVAT